MQCAQERIETVQQVYEKHISEEKMTKDGYERRSESVMQKGNRTSETKVYQNVTPRRSLAPKSLSYALTDINEHQAIDNNGDGKNKCLDLVGPNANADNNGIISAMNQSITNSPLIKKNGMAWYERTVTTTTTTTTTVTEKVLVPPSQVPNSPFVQTMDAIDVGMFSAMLNIL